MICGNCQHTDGLCYTSSPPQCHCNITGELHYYADECNCNDDVIVSKTETLSDKAPAIAITGEEAAVAYESLLNIPLYGERDGTRDNKISIKPYTSTIDLDEVDKRLLAPIGIYATKCLVCDTEVPVYFLGGGRVVCHNCKKAIKFIKEKFSKELENYD